MFEAEARGGPPRHPARRGAARRLRGIVDPARLEPRFELEVESWYGRTPLAVQAASHSCTITSPCGMALARDFRELKVRRRSGAPRLEALARAIGQSRGLRPVLQTKMARARELLRQMGREAWC